MEALVTVVFQNNTLTVISGRERLLNKTGIYEIRCLANGFTYYGSSAQRRGVRARIQKHFSELRRGCHHNWHLQKDWDAYGSAAFEFAFVEAVTINDCLKREQEILDSMLGLGQCYNIMTIAEAPLALAQCPQGRHRNLGKSAKYFVAINPQGQVFTGFNLAAFCRKHNLRSDGMSNAANGRARHYKGWTCQYVDPENADSPDLRSAPNQFKVRAEQWIIIPPGGNPFITDNLAQLCKGRDINPASMASVSRGQLRQHKGWICQEVVNGDVEAAKRIALEKLEFYKSGEPTEGQKRAQAQLRKQDKWIVIPPGGKPFKTDNLTQLCKDRGLNNGNMAKAGRGQQRHHKGWICQEVINGDVEAAKRIALEKLEFYKSGEPTEAQKQYRSQLGKLLAKLNPNRRQYLLEDPQGQSYQVSNLSRFCREKELQRSRIHRVIQGKQKSYRGWTGCYSD